MLRRRSNCCVDALCSSAPLDPRLARARPAPPAARRLGAPLRRRTRGRRRPVRAAAARRPAAGRVHACTRPARRSRSAPGLRDADAVAGRARFDARARASRPRRAALRLRSTPSASAATTRRSPARSCSLRARPERGRRVGHRLGADDPRVPPRAPGAAPPQRRRGARLRQARRRRLGRRRTRASRPPSRRSTARARRRGRGALPRRAQPEVDPAPRRARGHSQAGWIMPLAATREPAIRFLVSFSGPAVTADENDLYQSLAGEGERPRG